MILEIGENRHELVFPPELAGTQQVIIDEGTPYVFQVPGPVSPPKPEDELRNYAQSYHPSNDGFCSVRQYHSCW